MKFQHNDGGRSASGLKVKHKRDCTVRALATATGTSYEDAFAWLREHAHAGLKVGGSYLPRELDAMPWRKANGYEPSSYNGIEFQKLSFPAVKGEKRMNPETFLRLYPTGSYLVSTARHMFAVVDGVIHDTWEQRPDRCIYSAWKVMK